VASAPLQEILGFTRRTTELTADLVRTIPGGWSFSTPSIPVAWGLNHLRFRVPVSFEDATAMADEAQRHLPFRQIVLEHGAIERELEQEFIRAGWKAERDLLMLLTGGPDRAADTGAVIDAGDEAHLELGRRWTLEEAPQTKPEVLSQLSEFWRRESHVRGDRLLGIAGAGGGLAAKAKLRCDGRVAQIEDVYTVAAERGRGHARALITRALQLAREQGHALIFIIADDDGWPKQLYQRIGFEPVGRMLHLHRELS